MDKKRLFPANLKRINSIDTFFFDFHKFLLLGKLDTVLRQRLQCIAEEGGAGENKGVRKELCKKRE